MNPRVSVILPFYNAELTIGRAIKSILSQSFYDFELLLVDNNSSDNSLQIALSFQENDQRIVLLTENRQGVAYAMNKGLEMARGKYIARMDSDDVSLPGRLFKQVEFLEQNNDIDLVGSYVKYVSHSLGKGGFQYFVNWVNSFYSTEAIEKKRFVEIPVVNPTIMFRQELYKKFGGCIHGDFPEDYEILLRYIDVGVKMYKIPEVLLEWNDYKTRLTRTDRRYSTKAFYKIKAEYFFRWSERHNQYHPKVWVWGAGRITRKRSELLVKKGIEIQGFIDFKEKKVGRKNCVSYKNIPSPGKIFIISMVGNYGARGQINNFLLNKKYVEGKDFILMA